MTIWGKILRSTAAFALGGPLGALISAVAGHAVDIYRQVTAKSAEGEEADATQQIAFTIGVIALGAKMAKADGVVTRHEVNAFKQVFHIPPDEMKNVGRVFDIARKDAQGFEPYARQIHKLLADRPAVLEDLLDGLFHIARADGTVHEAEIEYLRKVAHIFGFSDAEFERIRASNGCALREDDDYTVLGVTKAASNDEIKAAHRRQVLEHHPDRLIAQGLPAEFVEIANDKLAAINAAYDRIKVERGLRERA